ncbi:MAG: hypothetical protein K2M12_04555 [Muribaculaceae bacterium]|nr:hypothetical protein [Muribaculaceae bacterium]
MSDKYTQTEANVRGIFDSLRRLALGAADSIRLSMAERLTLLLSAIAIAGIAVILVTAILVFSSIGAAHMLASLTPHGAYFIVAGFYALLLVLLLVFRRRLVVDPVCRLITRLIVPPPSATELPAKTTHTTSSDHEHLHE